MDPSSPTSKIPYPEWQAEYLAALLEVDRKKLFERVTAAETAIFNRLQAMSHTSDGHAERQAIEDALASLRVLKRDNLGFPDLGKEVRITRQRERAKSGPGRSERTHSQTWRP
jgi:hypothetical protein